MASPFHTPKPKVDLAAPVVRVSRIRRDPPPAVKEISAADIKDQDARSVVIGVTGVALAVFVILLTLANAHGWTPENYRIEYHSSE